MDRKRHNCHVHNHQEGFQDLKNTYDLTKTDFFKYLHMRDYYAKNIKKNEDEIHPVIKVLIRAYDQAFQKIVSNLFLCLMESNKNSTVYVKIKWEGSWVRRSQRTFGTTCGKMCI